MRLYGFDNSQALTPATKLLLQACTAATASGRRTYAAEWERLVDMDKLEFSAMRLVPLFLHQNSRDGITTAYDKRLKVIYKYWWLKTQHIFNQLKAIHAMFIAAGIQPVVIKGASLMGYYPLAELRPMADFDLVVPPGDINKALQLLKSAGYDVKKSKESMLLKHKRLTLDFVHAIECMHKATGTQVDLHWKIGCLCSNEFTQNMLQHLQPYPGLPGGLKPGIGHEVFLIIMHAIIHRQKDNLNWLIDIDVLNRAYNKSFWQEARNIAVAEKKEKLFDYGCALLLKNGIYAPETNSIAAIILPISTIEKEKLRGLSLLGARVNKIWVTVTYQFAHKNWLYKTFQLVRHTRFLVANKRFYNMYNEEKEA